VRTVILLSCCLVLANSSLGPALAQNQWAPMEPSKHDRLEQQDPQTQAAEDAAKIMDMTLPFRDGQTLRYFAGDGTPEGYARRRQLTIWFYDNNDILIGRAERVSQAATQYFAADGSYLGRRINQRLVTAPSVTDYNRFAAPNQPDDGG
jgi:hypothetical protein